MDSEGTVSSSRDRLKRTVSLTTVALRGAGPTVEQISLACSAEEVKGGIRGAVLSSPHSQASYPTFAVLGARELAGERKRLQRSSASSGISARKTRGLGPAGRVEGTMPTELVIGLPVVAFKPLLGTGSQI